MYSSEVVNWLVRMVTSWWARPDDAVHRTIVVVDMVGFGHPQRTNPRQVEARRGMHRVLRKAFRQAGIPWEACHWEDRGDGVFLLAPPSVPKSKFTQLLPHTLVQALHEHNRAHPSQDRIRLRVGLHAGEVRQDPYGFTGAAINHAFRLVEAPVLKAALAESDEVLALIASSWFFGDVIQHSPDSEPETYQRVIVTVKETTAEAWIRLPESPTISIPTPRKPEQVPRQLPAIPSFFAGRRTALRQLDKTPISTISGMGGVGKTWLALRWAKDNLHRFPDGQLYVNLRGFDPAGEPTPVRTAVRGLLDALGVVPDTDDLDAMTALYRSLVSTKRLLILLDNAANSAQVTPLLPGGSSTVLVTSRHRLTGLIIGFGAQAIELDVLDDEEAYELLAGRIDATRMEAEPAAVAQLLRKCAGLPLALGIVAARATSHPEFRLGSLAAELDNRLDALNGGELSADLRAVMSWSYRALDDTAATLFRLLGLIPGPAISVLGAAALTGLPVSASRELLQDLANAHLVQQYTPGRYRMHDLVRLYAAEQGADPAAVRRLIEFYLHAAHAGERALYPDRNPIQIDDPESELPHFADDTAVLAWFDTELPCLLAAQATAARHGWDTLVWQLGWVLHGYLWRRGRIHEQLTTWRAGFAAAQRLGDVTAQSLAHRLYGQTATRAGRLPEARTHLEWALLLARKIGDRHGEARTHYDLGRACDDSAMALGHASGALLLFKELDNPVWEAEALNLVGWHQAMLGNLAPARAACERALVLFSEYGNRQGRATTLASLALIARRCEESDQALSFYRDSLALFQELGARYEEADTLDDQGRLYAALGHTAEAERAWRQALGLYVEQNRTEAAEGIRRHLAIVAV
jgi:tetratricopeptide (TPR) repeat protein